MCLWVWKPVCADACVPCRSLCVTIRPIYVHLCHVPVQACVCPWVSMCLRAACGLRVPMCAKYAMCVPKRAKCIMCPCAHVCHAPLCAHTCLCVPVCAACPCVPIRARVRPCVPCVPVCPRVCMCTVRTTRAHVCRVLSHARRVPAPPVRVRVRVRVQVGAAVSPGKLLLLLFSHRCPAGCRASLCSP